MSVVLGLLCLGAVAGLVPVWLRQGPRRSLTWVDAGCLSGSIVFGAVLAPTFALRLGIVGVAALVLVLKRYQADRDTRTERALHLYGRTRRDRAMTSVRIARARTGRPFPSRNKLGRGRGLRVERSS